MNLNEITVGQAVRVRDGYGWSVEVRNGQGLLTGHDFRDLSGVTRVLRFTSVLTDQGWQQWPVVSKGCLAFHIDPADLDPLPEQGVEPAVGEE